MGFATTQVMGGISWKYLRQGFTIPAFTADNDLILNLNAVGRLYRYYVRVDAAVDAELVAPMIMLDDVEIFEDDKVFQKLARLGYDTSSRPIQLLIHSKDGECAATIYFTNGIPFSYNCKLGLRNFDGVQKLGHAEYMILVGG